jgi:hypothetical protein
LKIKNIERRLTIQSEFAVLADYEVVDKIIIQLKNIWTNADQINENIYKFINKVIILL